MNSRFVFAPDYVPCSPGNGSGSDAGPANPRIRPSSRNSAAPTFLIRLAMKVSRARWYSFMRRVFHYQNGSGSDLGPNPFNTRNWMAMEFITLAVQVSVTVHTLIVSGDERPVWPMRLWVSGYAFGCFMSLLLVCWRYRVIYGSQRDGSSVSGVEQQRGHGESRSLQYMHKCRTSVELLFAIWFVMGNVWVFDSRFGSFNRAPQLHILCISLLAWNAISYSFPFILFVLLCCCVPILSTLLGYNMNMASLERGATDEQLDSLKSWKYKDVGSNLDLGNPDRKDENSECCICLARYKDKEEIRQLPCTHFFHLNCVDQWLKILSCCPLCKQEIDKL